MKTILFTILCCSCFIVTAQLTTPKNELGLNLYGLEIDVDYLGDGLYQPYYMNGLQYKRQLGAHYKWRISGQYFTRHEDGSMDFEPMGPHITWNYVTTTYEIRSGIERAFFKSTKFTPFVFADIVYRNQKDKGTASSAGGDIPWNGTSYSDINRTMQYGGLIGGVGLKYSPIPAVYIGAEASIGKYYQIFSGQQKVYSETYFSPIKTLVFGVLF